MRVPPCIAVAMVSVALASGLTIAQAQEIPPRLDDCQRHVSAGAELCVCGHFPGQAVAGLRLDGRLLEEATIPGPHSAKVRLPADLTPGAHVLSGDPGNGFAPSEQVLVEVIEVRFELDSARLLRGQSTQLRLQVLGTRDPMGVTLVNRTPDVIRLVGGDEQRFETSGGALNGRVVQIDSLRPGEFDISYQLDDESCDCPEPDPDDDADPLPAAVVALIAQLPPAGTATVQALAAANGLVVTESSGLVSAGLTLAVLGIPDGRGVPAVVAALQADPRVQLAQPDFLYTTQAPRTPSQSRRRQADRRTLWWGPGSIGASRLRKRPEGRGIRIGVLDSGVDSTSPELRDAVVVERDFTGEGLTPDVHGTQVASILAARSVEDREHEGIAPRATLAVAKVCRPASPRAVRARCRSSTLAKGVDWAIQQDARILNLSIAGRSEDRLLMTLFEVAESNGRLVVAAAGNEGPEGAPAFPARLGGVLAVTAIDVDHRLYERATRGDYVDLAAPGVEILTLAPGGRQPLTSGTSFATAFVSGGAALLLELFGEVAPEELRQALFSSAEDLGARGRDPSYGWGLIDLCRASRELGGRGC